MSSVLRSRTSLRTLTLLFLEQGLVNYLTYCDFRVFTILVTRISVCCRGRFQLVDLGIIVEFV